VVFGLLSAVNLTILLVSASFLFLTVKLAWGHDVSWGWVGPLLYFAEWLRTGFGMHLGDWAKHLTIMAFLAQIWFVAPVTLGLILLRFSPALKWLPRWLRLTFVVMTFSGLALGLGAILWAFSHSPHP
jgi:hypothetical protein